MAEMNDLHWMPCSIAHNGPAKVGAYFLPAQTGKAVDSQPVQVAYFRGRELKGATLQLPEGYRGQVLRQAAEADPAPAAAWKLEATFDSLTYWKHGCDPVRSDAAQKRMEYLRISQQLHAPVREEDILEELRRPTMFGSDAPQRDPATIC